MRQSFDSHQRFTAATEADWVRQRAVADSQLREAEQRAKNAVGDVAQLRGDNDRLRAELERCREDTSLAHQQVRTVLGGWLDAEAAVV